MILEIAIYMLISRHAVLVGSVTPCAPLSIVRRRIPIHGTRPTNSALVKSVELNDCDSQVKRTNGY
jgi:hypothetical protein